MLPAAAALCRCLMVGAAESAGDRRRDKPAATNGRPVVAGGGGRKMPNVNLILLGEVTRGAGVAALVAGLFLSLHHWPAAAALIGGGTAFYVGKKLRAQ